MYDPTIGRWLQQDPEGFDAGDPNLYRYVNNDPTNLVDPSGLEPQKDEEKPDPKPGTAEFNATTTGFSAVNNSDLIDRALVDDDVGKRMKQRLNLRYDIPFNVPQDLKATRQNIGAGFGLLQITENQAKTAFSFAFLSNVRFTGNFKNVSNAGFIQTVKRVVFAEDTKNKKEKESVSYVIEGFGAKDGKAVEFDSHAFESGKGEISINSGEKITWTATFKVGIGRYNNKAPVGFEMYYEKQAEWTKEDLDKITWLGPTKTYTVSITIGDNAKWVWKDQSLPIDSTGTGNAIDPPNKK